MSASADFRDQLIAAPLKRTLIPPAYATPSRDRNFRDQLIAAPIEAFKAAMEPASAARVDWHFRDQLIAAFIEALLQLADPRPHGTNPKIPRSADRGPIEAEPSPS